MKTIERQEVGLLNDSLINMRSRVNRKTKEVFIDPKANEFLYNHWHKVILPFGIEHRNEIGYTQVWVKPDYTIRSMNFTREDFNRRRFSYIGYLSDQSKQEELYDVFNLYFEILYEATKTKTMFYGTMMIYQTMDYSIFKPLLQKL